MLLRFQFSNFRSFREEQELSLIADAMADSPSSVIRSPAVEEGILPVAAIYGANASGKTNVLKAFRFLSDAVTKSHREWAPEARVLQQPFRLDPNSKPRSSKIVVDIVVQKVRYQYGFVASPDLFEKEWLYAYPEGRQQKLFVREASKPMTFSRKLAGENVRTEKLMRPNSLFLSAAAQNNHSGLIPIYEWFSELEFVLTPREPNVTAALVSNSDMMGHDVASFLRSADLGIKGLRLKPGNELEILHGNRGSGAAFSLHDESEGTVTYLSLLGPLLFAIHHGRVVCVDELDASLHPLLAAQIVQVFQNPKTNPKHAQLIFNTHDTNLLSPKLLRRDQVWLTEKDRDGSSHLYPITEFKPRKGENLENGYLQGRYGAIPFIDSAAFTSALSGGHGKRK
jgi:uncharacterized protein